MHRKIQYRPRIRLNARRRLHRLVSHAEASMPRLPPPAVGPAGSPATVGDRSPEAGPAPLASGTGEGGRPETRVGAQAHTSGCDRWRKPRPVREAVSARGARSASSGRRRRRHAATDVRAVAAAPAARRGSARAVPSGTGRRSQGAPASPNRRARAKASRHGRPASRVAGNGRPRAPASAARRRGVSAQGTLAATGGPFDDGAEACTEPWPAPRGVRSAALAARCVGFPGPAHLTPLLLPARGRRINNILWLMALGALNVGPRPY